MRFSEGPTVEVEVRIAAPPDVVWPFASDITVPPRFSAELVEATWESEAYGPGPGARFVGRSRHPAIGEWQTTSTVTEFHAPVRFAWEVEGGGGAAAAWHFELAADGDGTILRQWARLGPGASGLSSALEARPDKEEQIIAGRLGEWRENMTRTVEGIRDLVEASLR